MTVLSIGLLYGAATLVVMFAGMPIAFALGAVATVFMSAAAIQAQRGHVAIEAIVGLLPQRVNRARIVLVDAASLLFCGYFTWKSFTLLHEAIVDDYHSSSTWGPPLWIPYSLMSVGMLLLSIQLLLQIVGEWRHRNSVAA